MIPCGGRMPIVTVDAAGALNELVAKVGAEHADLEVTGELVDGDPVHVLLDAAKKARLLVVGTRARIPWPRRLSDQSRTAWPRRPAVPSP